MKILDVREMWIHTHFLTDCVRLPSDRMREIQSEMEPFLRERRIQYGFHFEEHKGEQGIRIVLECIPLPKTLEQIRDRLKEAVKEIPVRPQPVRGRVLES